ncbi:unnamed protein product [Lepidochelys olivacea]
MPHITGAPLPVHLPHIACAPHPVPRLHIAPAPAPYCTCPYPTLHLPHIAGAPHPEHLPHVAPHPPSSSLPHVTHEHRLSSKAKLARSTEALTDLDEGSPAASQDCIREMSGEAGGEAESCNPLAIPSKNGLLPTP